MKKQELKRFSQINSRLKIIIFLVLIPFTLIISKLYDLQIRNGTRFRLLSDKNYIQISSRKAPRGFILDRNGEILADNRICYDLYMITEVKRAENIAIINRLNSEIGFKISHEQAEYSYQPRILARDIGVEKYIKIKTAIPEYSNIYIKSRSVRFYPYNELCFHVLGYVSLIPEDLLKSSGYSEYDSQDYIGYYGIEELFEQVLKGKDGIALDIINAVGKPISNPEIVNLTEIKQTLKRELERKPEPGDNIYLTIDINLQRKVEELLSGHRGTIIVLDTKTGEVLALASRTVVNGNIFIKGLSQEDWSNISTDPSFPLLNRAIQGRYNPGSIFKIILAAALLDQDLEEIEKDFEPCKGKINLDNVTKYCWKKEGHGKIKFEEAMAYSCNIYFYQLGRYLTVDSIERYAKLFNLDKKTGIQLKNEKEGVIPSRAWKKSFFDKADDQTWWPPETLDLAIGQGFVQVTPLSMAVFMSTVANDGVITRPLIIKSVVDMYNNLRFKTETEVIKNVNISKEDFEIIKHSLYEVVNKRKPRWGSGWRAAVENLEVCGKTGTAQVVRLIEERRTEEGDQNNIPFRFRDHAWFAGFAPYNNPQITVVVMIEHGGYGGSIAAPIAAEIFKECHKLGYIKLDTNQEEQTYLNESTH
ncbi:MAG TPA: penicillin-binding protein 2 [Firmicutes bacterium]|nr:penicillin-binding protein 2 [Bacillota bacterium]